MPVSSASRRFETVEVEFGGERFEVTVKIAADDEGTVYDVSAEYDDAARVADAAGVPVREVLDRAAAARRR